MAQWLVMVSDSAGVRSFRVDAKDATTAQDIMLDHCDGKGDVVVLPAKGEDDPELSKGKWKELI